jgi:hypothetical protein
VRNDPNGERNAVGLVAVVTFAKRWHLCPALAPANNSCVLKEFIFVTHSYKHGNFVQIGLDEECGSIGMAFISAETR